MATSITAAGIVFPDSSVQTTAASASGGTTEAIASGSLSNGSTVIVNANGTVSVVQAADPAVVFTSNAVSYVASTYDSTNNKIVVCYKDDTNSNYGTAVVGTVSGTSISFGTPVVFNSVGIEHTAVTFDSANSKVVVFYAGPTGGSSSSAQVGTVSGTSISFGTGVVFESGNALFNSAVYDSLNGKVVVAFTDVNNSYYGTARVGTVSGTSISFGTAVVFESAFSLFMSTAYDSTNNKIVISYNDDGNSGYGTARVGTVSGTSISFGTTVVFRSALVDHISSTYDATNNRVVIAYRDFGNSLAGTAIVGTVSGTSISFGSSVVFTSQATNTSTVFDSTNNKVVISYTNFNNSSYGTSIVGTVSGTSISFGSAFVFESASTTSISATYNSTNDRVVISYRDNGNSNSGTTRVFNSINGLTNLTAENFIGFSDAAYTNGQTATIQIAGAVDDAQSGLTPGQAYYVQTNGTLGLTPADPLVFAGTAISATKIVVQG